jgi:hypothetical protein
VARNLYYMLLRFCVKSRIHLEWTVDSDPKLCRDLFWYSETVSDAPALPLSILQLSGLSTGEQATQCFRIVFSNVYRHTGSSLLVHCITVVLSVAGRLPIVVFLRALKATESDAQRKMASADKERKGSGQHAYRYPPVCVCVRQPIWQFVTWVGWHTSGEH